MERREAMRNIAFLLGSAISAPTLAVLLGSCNQTDVKSQTPLFTRDQDELITEIADIIIPTTDTPGAKAAGVGPFISMMIVECYPEELQQVFVQGLQDVENKSDSKFGKSFVNLTVQQRNDIVKNIVDETAAMRKQERKEKGEKANKPYFFQLIKDLTTLGYFTSEIGATKALGYVAVPGRFDACIDI